MLDEFSGRAELSQPVTYHIFRYSHLDEILAVVHAESKAYHFRRYLGIPGQVLTTVPSIGFQNADFLQQFFVNIRSFFKLLDIKIISFFRLETINTLEYFFGVLVYTPLFLCPTYFSHGSCLSAAFLLLLQADGLPGSWRYL